MPIFQGINHVTVVVTDKPLAENFYCNQLEFEKVQVGKSLWAKVGNQYIHINEDKNRVPLKTFQHFAIGVSPLHPYLNELISKNLEIFDLDDDLNKLNINRNLDVPGRCFFLYDPFGNLLEFVDANNEFFKQ